MTKKKEEKKELTNEELLAEIKGIVEPLIQRVQRLEERTDENEGRLEIHGKMFREQPKLEEEVKGLLKEDYPQWCHDLVEDPESSVKWVKVVPKISFNSPGITIDGFTVPFHKDVASWTLTTWQKEAEGRGIL